MTLADKERKLVLAPPKLLLDSCHVIKIARLRSGRGKVDNADAYAALDDYLQNRHFGLIHSPAATLEWVDGNATLETALELANVIDSYPLQYEIEPDSFVFLREVLGELREIEPGLQLPCFEVLHTRVIGTEVERATSVLISDVPCYFDDADLATGARSLPRAIPFGTTRQCIERAWVLKSERREIFDQRSIGYKEAFDKDSELLLMRSHKSIKSDDIVGWMKRYLRIDRVIASLNPDADIDSLLSRVRIDRCPAITLYMKAREKRVRSLQEIDGNDVDDWQLVSVMPYADVILTEKNLAHYVVQADSSYSLKVTSSSQQALKLLEPWL